MGKLIYLRDPSVMNRQEAVDYYRQVETNIEQGMAELRVSGDHLKSLGKPPLDEMFDIFPDDEGA